MGTAGLEVTAVDLVSPPTSMPILRNRELGVSKDLIQIFISVHSYRGRKGRKRKKKWMDGWTETITTLRITSELFPLLNT